MKLATFNVNSIRSRMEIITNWLKQHQPDALCMQETKASDANFPISQFDGTGYHVAYRGERGQAGVAIATKKELADVAFGIDDGGQPDEDRLVRGKLGKVHIVNTYVPQGRDRRLPQYKYKLEWMSRLINFFSKHYKPGDLLIWCGDLNVAPLDIDVHDPKRIRGHVDFNPEVQAAFQHVVDWGFVDVFRKHHPEPGHYSFFDYRVPRALERKMGWRVDHIMATKPLAEKSTDSFIDLEPRELPKASDHTVLVAEFKL